MFAQRRVRRRTISAAPYARCPGSGAGICRAETEYSHQTADHDQKSHGAASVPPPVRQSVQHHPVATVASERRRWQMLMQQPADIHKTDVMSEEQQSVLFMGNPTDHPGAAGHNCTGSNLCPPSFGLHTQQQSVDTFSATVVVSGKQNCICRFCKCILASSSNRHRHERLKHASELQSLVDDAGAAAAGNSRKQCSAAAYSRPTASVTSESAMEMELAGFQLLSTDRGVHQLNDPVQETDVHVSGDHDAGDLDNHRVTTSAPASESKEQEEGTEEGKEEGKEEKKDEKEEENKQDTVDVAQNDAVAAQNGPVEEPAPEAELVCVPLLGDLIVPVEDQQAEAIPMESNSDAAADHVLMAEGARPLLQVEDLQTAAYPFMQWLASPCMTATEALVKGKRVKSFSQLAPIKNTLKFLFALLYEGKVIDTIDLKVLIRLSVTQALYQAVVDRQVGSGRMHQIFLLVKKVLVFLSSTESARCKQFVQPTAYESYLYVENVCGESSDQRKQEARNRMVLGTSGPRGVQPLRKEAFQIPKTWSANSSNPVPPLPSLAPAALPAELHGVESSDSHNHTMTKEELSLVTKACLVYLKSSVGNAKAPPADHDLSFLHYLITATLCLGLAPRSQVLQQLRIGSSLRKEADGLYWIRMRAQESKNGRPTMFALADDLTFAYDHYLQNVRPRLLARSTKAASQHDYVFFKRSGAAPRTDFSTSTCLVTQQVLGRSVNAHAFRSALVTTFFSSGASAAEMSVLASIMAHDPATQRNFYYKPQHNTAAVQTSQRMSAQLLTVNA